MKVWRIEYVTIPTGYSPDVAIVLAQDAESAAKKVRDRAKVTAYRIGDIRRVECDLIIR